MLAIAGLFCLVAVHGQAAALEVNQTIFPAWRIGNAAISYAVYLGQFFWPLGLSAGLSPPTCPVAVLAGGSGVC